MQARNIKEKLQVLILTMPDHDISYLLFVLITKTMICHEEPIIKSRRVRWAEHVAQRGDKRKAYRILVGKPEGGRLLGRPRCRWVDNVKKNLGEIG
jgi:hypothetical protein